MATWAELERIALALPRVVEVAGGHDGWRTWKLEGDRGRQVVWERPLRPSDITQLTGAGRELPAGELVAVRVADLDAKAERLAELPSVCLDIPHFERFTGLLVRLDAAAPSDLQELVEESWLAVAPKRLAAQWRADQGPA